MEAFHRAGLDNGGRDNGVPGLRPDYGEAYFAAFLIDLAAEKARLEKAIDKAKAEAARIQGKLSNEKFVANAKPDVVEAERERFTELEQQLASLSVALTRVSEAG